MFVIVVLICSGVLEFVRVVLEGLVGVCCCCWALITISGVLGAVILPESIFRLLLLAISEFVLMFAFFDLAML